MRIAEFVGSRIWVAACVLFASIIAARPRAPLPVPPPDPTAAQIEELRQALEDRQIEVQFAPPHTDEELALLRLQIAKKKRELEQLKRRIEGMRGTRCGGVVHIPAQCLENPLAKGCS
jgi:hypothetical protein